MIDFLALKQNGTYSLFSIFRSQFSISFICALCVLCGSISLPVNAQVRPIYDQGAIGLGQILKRLNNTKSVMMIGAHPDDEDSGLLAYLARGENARTAYLSLTRGDGGQNRLGKELFEPLGIIRTEELLQARRLDGAEHYFTRAFDYGYSKTLAEAKSKWDEKVILCDVVRSIRTFRPLVVISRFSGTKNDGHGQHQFAGYISPKAVKAAADPTQCKQKFIHSWQVKKFYTSHGFRNRSEPKLRVNTGKYDPLIGRSYFEIAIQGRTQHKSQEQGFLELRGDKFSGLNLVGKETNETGVFDGVDTSLANFLSNYNIDTELLEKDVANKLANLWQNLRSASEGFDPNNPYRMLSNLIRAKAMFANFRSESVRKLSNKEISESVFQNNLKLLGALTPKSRQLNSAIKLASGLKIDVLASSETISGGESFLASIRVFYSKSSALSVKKIELRTPRGWKVAEGKEQQSNSPFARFFRETANKSRFFTVTVPQITKFTQPYFLEKPRNGYLYNWRNDHNQSFPFQWQDLRAIVTIEHDGKTITLHQPIEYRMRDQLRGELRRNLNIVPKVSLDIDQHLLVVPKSSKSKKRTVSLNVLCNSSSKSKGKATLNVPKGWRVSPRSTDVILNKKGESASFDFEITIPANTKADSYKIKAIAEIGGEKFDQTMNTVAYDHIQTHRYYTKAETKVNVFDLKTAPVKVGYIMGSGDQIPEAIRQMGFDVELLDKKYLTNGDFSRYDTIVVGIRASETRNDYIANNARLHKYVEQGGTLIVQYQKFAFLRHKLAPFPARYNARVAEEDAKVTILVPNHPVFNFPNKITQEDFKSWVQERNLYAFKTFDEKYTPLLESHDTGEPENKGAMVYAEIGKGKYMYCSYSFFRQLPAGVPGAYRLFSNILSLSKAKK